MCAVGAGEALLGVAAVQGDVYACVVARHKPEAAECAVGHARVGYVAHFYEEVSDVERLYQSLHEVVEQRVAVGALFTVYPFAVDAAPMVDAGRQYAQVSLENGEHVPMLFVAVVGYEHYGGDAR